jgi:hypothetical protein
MSALSATAKHEYCVVLGNSLPPPVLDQPEYRQRRFTTAIETFEALRPGDAYEAQLAVRIVLCGAHAVESLREAGVYREDFAKRTRCRAQAASMMRAESAAKRALEREQKVRLATEAVASTAEAQPAAASAAPPQAELQAPPPVQAAAAAPPAPMPPAVAPALPAATPAAAAPPPVPATAAAPPVPAAAAAPPAPMPPAVAPQCPAAAPAAPQPAAAETAPPPSPEAIAKAEAYAREEGVAAAQIRHDRGVTPQNKAYFRRLTLPTDPALIDALVRGTTDLLTLLDEIGGETLDKAA